MRIARPLAVLFALGLFGAGPYPAFNWVEITQYEEVLHFGDTTLDLWQTGLVQEVSALGILLTVFLFVLATTFHWVSHRYGVRR